MHVLSFKGGLTVTLNRPGFEASINQSMIIDFLPTL